MMIPFRAIGVFFYVASRRSVSQAAQELGVTPSAVSQQLRTLEEQLQTTLVTKAGRQIRLTEAGERYFEMIAGEMERIVGATRQIRGAPKTSLLTIRSTPTLSTKWLLPRLNGLVEANPNLDIRLDGTNEPTDFSREPIDIEIRHGTGRWGGLHVAPLVEELFFPVAAPALIAAGSLRSADLLDYPLIYSLKSQVQWRDWLRDHAQCEPPGRRRLMFDRSHMVVDAAAAGMGVALESILMMDRELEAGRLVLPLAETPRLTATTHWLVCPYQNLRRARVARFIEWIEAEAAAWRNKAEALFVSLSER
jgi:LysR family transcriptional regulator, glycine cleavage system transcriptional activator